MRLFFLALVIFASVSLRAVEVPKGFENPQIFARVMKGELVTEEHAVGKTQFTSVTRAFFHKASPEAYVKLAVDHHRYAQWFAEVKEGTTLKVSDAHDDYLYKLHVLYKLSFLSKHLYPEGHQTIRQSGLETIVTNDITNYKDSIKAAGQLTRLIPWEDGFLLEDTVRLELPKESGLAGVVKNKMREFFTRYVSKFRSELHANY